MKKDQAYDKVVKGKKVGIVGESHIWDGPLNQQDRAHAVGSSSGIKGMKVSQFPLKYMGSPITKVAQGD